MAKNLLISDDWFQGRFPGPEARDWRWYRETDQYKHLFQLFKNAGGVNRAIGLLKSIDPDADNLQRLKGKVDDKDIRAYLFLAYNQEITDQDRKIAQNYYEQDLFDWWWTTDGLKPLAYTTMKGEKLTLASGVRITNDEVISANGALLIHNYRVPRLLIIDPKTGAETKVAITFKPAKAGANWWRSTDWFRRIADGTAVFSKGDSWRETYRKLATKDLSSYSKAFQAYVKAVAAAVAKKNTVALYVLLEKWLRNDASIFAGVSRDAGCLVTNYFTRALTFSPTAIAFAYTSPQAYYKTLAPGWATWQDKAKQIVAPSTQNTRTLVVFGDSWATGYGSRNEEDSFVALLYNRLSPADKARFRCLNYSAAGKKSDEALSQVRGLLDSLAKIPGKKTAFFVIGGNDVSNADVNGSRPGRYRYQTNTAANILEAASLLAKAGFDISLARDPGVRQLVRLAQATGAYVVLIGTYLPPDLRDAHNLTAEDKKALGPGGDLIAKYNLALQSIYDRVAAAYSKDSKFRYVQNYWDPLDGTAVGKGSSIDLSDSSMKTLKLSLADGVHPKKSYEGALFAPIWAKLDGIFDGDPAFLTPTLPKGNFASPSSKAGTVSVVYNLSAATTRVGKLLLSISETVFDASGGSRGAAGNPSAKLVVSFDDGPWNQCAFSAAQIALYVPAGVKRVTFKLIVGKDVGFTPKFTIKIGETRVAQTVVLEPDGLYQRDKGDSTDIAIGDIVQNAESQTCYFLAALQALASTKDGAAKIQKLITAKDGVYYVTFANGDKVSVPESRLREITLGAGLGPSGHELWARLLEFAYVNAAQPGEPKYSPNWYKVDGDPREALEALTGDTFRGEDATLEQTYTNLNKALGKPVVIGTKNTLAAEDKLLRANHAYAVLSYVAKSSVYTLADTYDNKTIKVSKSDLKTKYGERVIMQGSQAKWLNIDTSGFVNLRGFFATTKGVPSWMKQTAAVNVVNLDSENPASDETITFAGATKLADVEGRVFLWSAFGKRTVMRFKKNSSGSYRLEWNTLKTDGGDGWRYGSMWVSIVPSINAGSLITLRKRVEFDVVLSGRKSLYANDGSAPSGLEPYLSVQANPGYSLDLFLTTPYTTQPNPGMNGVGRSNLAADFWFRATYGVTTQWNPKFDDNNLTATFGANAWTVGLRTVDVLARGVRRKVTYKYTKDNKEETAVRVDLFLAKLQFTGSVTYTNTFMDHYNAMQSGIDSGNKGDFVTYFKLIINELPTAKFTLAGLFYSALYWDYFAAKNTASYKEEAAKNRKSASGRAALARKWLSSAFAVAFNTFFHDAQAEVNINFTLNMALSNVDKLPGDGVYGGGSASAPSSSDLADQVWNMIQKFKGVGDSLADETKSFSDRFSGAARNMPNGFGGSLAVIGALGDEKNLSRFKTEVDSAMSKKSRFRNFGVGSAVRQEIADSMLSSYFQQILLAEMAALFLKDFKGAGGSSVKMPTDMSATALAKFINDVSKDILSRAIAGIGTILADPLFWATMATYLTDRIGTRAANVELSNSFLKQLNDTTNATDAESRAMRSGIRTYVVENNFDLRNGNKELRTAGLTGEQAFDLSTGRPINEVASGAAEQDRLRAILDKMAIKTGKENLRAVATRAYQSGLSGAQKLTFDRLRATDAASFNNDLCRRLSLDPTKAASLIGSRSNASSLRAKLDSVAKKYRSDTGLQRIADGAYSAGMKADQMAVYNRLRRGGSAFERELLRNLSMHPENWAGITKSMNATRLGQLQDLISAAAKELTGNSVITKLNTAANKWPGLDSGQRAVAEKLMALLMSGTDPMSNADARLVASKMAQNPNINWSSNTETDNALKQVRAYRLSIAKTPAIFINKVSGPVGALVEMVPLALALASGNKKAISAAAGSLVANVGLLGIELAAGPVGWLFAAVTMAMSFIEQPINNLLKKNPLYALIPFVSLAFVFNKAVGAIEKMFGSIVKGIVSIFSPDRKVTLPPLTPYDVASQMYKDVYDAAYKTGGATEDEKQNAGSNAVTMRMVADGVITVDSFVVAMQGRDGFDPSKLVYNLNKLQADRLASTIAWDIALKCFPGGNVQAWNSRQGGKENKEIIAGVLRRFSNNAETIKWSQVQFYSQWLNIGVGTAGILENEVSNGYEKGSWEGFGLVDYLGAPSEKLSAWLNELVALGMLRYYPPGLGSGMVFGNVLDASDLVGVDGATRTSVSNLRKAGLRNALMAYSVNQGDQFKGSGDQLVSADELVNAFNDMNPTGATANWMDSKYVDFILSSFADDYSAKGPIRRAGLGWAELWNLVNSDVFYFDLAGGMNVRMSNNRGLRNLGNVDALTDLVMRTWGSEDSRSATMSYSSLENAMWRLGMLGGATGDNVDFLKFMAAGFGGGDDNVQWSVMRDMISAGQKNGWVMNLDAMNSSQIAFSIYKISRSKDEIIGVDEMLGVMKYIYPGDPVQYFQGDGYEASGWRYMDGQNLPWFANSNVYGKPFDDLSGWIGNYFSANAMYRSNQWNFKSVADLAAALETDVFRSALGRKPAAMAGALRPVVLDLDGNGLQFTSLSQSAAQYDVDGSGARRNLAWVGQGDGILAYDVDGDGRIEKTNEIAFTGYKAGAKTDLEGLAAFDTNADGALDTGDRDWKKFVVWIDKNGDGVSDAGELKSLDEIGVARISLMSDGKRQTVNDVTLVGTSTFTTTDGRVGSVGDAGFAINPNALSAAEIARRRDLLAQALASGKPQSGPGVFEPSTSSASSPNLLIAITR